jgi:hypothetical protein
MEFVLRFHVELCSISGVPAPCVRDRERECPDGRRSGVFLGRFVDRAARLFEIRGDHHRVELDFCVEGEEKGSAIAGIWEALGKSRII